MPTPPAPGIVSLEAIWLQEDQPVENTFHYAVSGTIDVAVLDAMATTYITWVNAHLPGWHEACALVKIQARDLTSTSGASIIRNIIPAVDGTGTGAALPNNVTFSLKRQTGLRGRSERGRVFLIGVSMSIISAGSQELLADAAASYITTYNALLAAQLGDNAAQEVIYHKALGTGTPVIGYAFSDLFLDSQRRRLPGHNRHH